ncbi:MAG: flagellin [Methanomicrobiaceae archaeon]|uniref:flagellin n=1 Tax=Methanoculleus sp. TaxID=90427 RepID=UPI0032108375|nr:flagellin [Methanomicrobiaceae archaeon]
MSSEAFTTAMFLIAAIVSAGVLINAVFPVIYTLAGTISSSSHQVDERLSNDVKIVTTYASGGSKEARIWLKNVGTSRISPSDIGKADVFLGAPGNFTRLGLILPPGTPGPNQWTYEILEDTQKNNNWDPGETLYIRGYSDAIPGTGEVVYIQFVLSTGLSRSTTFTAGT